MICWMGWSMKLLSAAAWLCGQDPVAWIQKLQAFTTMVLWYNSCSFGHFLHVLVHVARKSLHLFGPFFVCIAGTVASQGTEAQKRIMSQKIIQCPVTESAQKTWMWFGSFRPLHMKSGPVAHSFKPSLLDFVFLFMGSPVAESVTDLPLVQGLNRCPVIGQ